MSKKLYINSSKIVHQNLYCHLLKNEWKMIVFVKFMYLSFIFRIFVLIFLIYFFPKDIKNLNQYF